MNKIKNYANRINNLLNEHKRVIDELGASYTATNKRIREEAQRMDGKWTKEYQREYIQNNAPDAEYSATFNTARSNVKPKIDFYLKLIDKTIERYFNAPMSQDFVNKVTAIKTMGISLTDGEFQLLEKEAKTYLENRLLVQLGENRVTEKPIYSRENGEPTAEMGEALNPYGLGKEKLPTIDSAKVAFDNFKRRAVYMAEMYAGKDGELWEFVGNGVEQFNCVSADSFMVNDACGEFTEALKPFLLQNYSGYKGALTQQEVCLIDTIIDKRYPSEAKKKIIEICKNSSDLTELLLLDGRYAKTTEEILMQE